MGVVNVQIVPGSETREYADIITVVKRATVTVVPSECNHTSGWDVYQNNLNQICILFLACEAEICILLPSNDDDYDDDDDADEEEEEDDDDDDDGDDEVQDNNGDNYEDDYDEGISGGKKRKGKIYLIKGIAKGHHFLERV